MTEQDKHITHIADLIVAELTGKIDDSGRRELENCKNLQGEWYRRNVGREPGHYIVM